MKTNRYMNLLVALIATAMFVLVSCKEEGEKIEPITISLSEEVISLVAGTEHTLTATVTPPGSKIEWLSNKGHVATVENGVVKAISEGTAKIVAKSDMSNAICEVIVTNVAVNVTGIVLDQTELEMKVEDMVRLIPTLEPYEATDRRVSWSSSNEEVVSVQQDGTLTAQGLGEAVITATTLDGNHTATCTIAVVGSIELNAPANNSNFKLNPVDGTKKVTFSWKSVEGIDKYLLRFSASASFEESNIIHTVEVSTTSVDVAEYTLNELVKNRDGNAVSLYWSIFSGTDGISVLPESRRIELVPDRRDYLRLSEGSESGIQVVKKEGEYHYALTANGVATVNTVGLAKDVPIDSGTVALRYKSNQALPSLTLNFTKEDGTVSGSISQAVAASNEWKDLHIQQAELPAGWGNAGDYIQLDFGNVSGYQMELNGIHLQKGVYIPEILNISTTGYNYVNILVHEDNYIKFTILPQNPDRTDPILLTTPFTQKLPAKAVLFSFEYKSDISMDPTDGFQVFLGPLVAPYPSSWGASVPKNDSGEWKEFTVNITSPRQSQAGLGWGQVGHFLRLDPGNYSTGITMEMRNIQIKYLE